MVNRQLKVLAALTASTSLANAELTVSETDAAITVTDGDNVVLAYHKAEVPPPEGADPAYHRSGFINPIRTPAGGVVTGGALIAVSRSPATSDTVSARL